MMNRNPFSRQSLMRQYYVDNPEEELSDEDWAVKLGCTVMQVRLTRRELMNERGCQLEYVHVLRRAKGRALVEPPIARATVHVVSTNIVSAGALLAEYPERCVHVGGCIRRPFCLNECQGKGALGTEHRLIHHSDGKTEHL